MFHYFLNTGDGNVHDPADALRAAQLWMLDQNRKALADLPPLLAEKAIHPGLAEVHAWAGYTYQGC